MPPRASTSGSAASGVKARGGKLSPIEQKLVDVGSNAPNREIAQADLFNQCGLTINQAVQDAVNSLLRKVRLLSLARACTSAVELTIELSADVREREQNLLQMLRTASGTILFRFLKKEEAKAMGSMDSEEKLVLDHIKDAGNLGIWTKTLTAKTGLPRTTITKVLKILEGRKAIKTVKSVKNPTRKIYMIAGLQPSVELTGGPWFTDNELDTELVDQLKKCAYKYLHDHVRWLPRYLFTAGIDNLSFLCPALSRYTPHSPASLSTRPRQPLVLLSVILVAACHIRQSVPKSSTFVDPSSHPSDDSKPATVKYRPIYPVTTTPYLPTVKQVLDFITGLEVAAVELLPEHVAALLDLMVYDGIVEKVFVGKPGAREEAKTNGKEKSQKGNASAKGKDKKGKRKKEDSDSEDDDDSDASPRKKGKGKKATVKRATNGKARKKRLKFDDDEEEESSESEDFDSDEEAPSRGKKGGDDEDDDEEEGGRKKSSKRRKKRDRTRKRVKRSSSDEEDGSDSDASDASDASTKKGYANGNGPYHPVIGWTDMPCGKCPVEEFCSEPPRLRAEAYKRPDLGAPKTKIELEGGIQGVGMLGGSGAAIGVSLAKWGEMKGLEGQGVAPVNPKDCVYFKEWLTF
ncbi:SPOSA6832_02985 [Sporobolomyces salmonicolor]|uniref:SPOSA6832_02985-mRNA-1:cds n=1 Tax=Sporidiobolus salmonicolor TaxID=5005 RepID=A0A0D6EML9_SPOSA|nr:SPOSA6832_02985 [Sporobolomyces salmonicolor]